MDPNAVYYLVFGGVFGLVGLAVDAFTSIPWWVVTGLGLLGAWAFTWLTALDDVRHPRRSLRILMATVRDPSVATRIRAALYELPLYAQTLEWAGTRQLSGGGLSFGAKLLSPARPSAEVTWFSGQANVAARTATRPRDGARFGGLPRGIGRQLAMLEDEPVLEGTSIDALADQVRPVTFSVDGRPLTGTVLDLSRTGYGWFAEVRLDDQFVLDLAGEGVEPDMLPLSKLQVADLPTPPYS